MKKFFVLLVFTLLLVSCTTFAPPPTATPTETATPLPTETPIPTSTNTPNPPTPTVDLIAALMPSGIPDSEWNGIPIMPEAINGEGDSQGYTFSVNSSPETVQQFYEQKLANLGFNLFAVGEGSERNSILLFFMKDIETVLVTIIPADDVLLITIVKT